MKQLFRRIPPDSSNKTASKLKAVNVMRRTAAIIFLALMASLLPAMPASARGLTLEVEGRYQNPGGVISIYGAAEPGAEVSIVVTSMMGEVILNTTVKADEDGSYTLQLTLEENATPGVYRVSAISDGESAEGSFTVTISALETIAERLIQIANRSRLRVEALMERLNSSGVEIPEEALEHYQHGVDALNKAVEALRDGRAEDSIRYAMEALREFREALRILLSEMPTTAAEDVAEEMRCLKMAIERAYSFLERMEEMADRLEDEGYNVSEVREMLDEARMHLEEAERLISDGEVEEAARELAAARGLLGRAWAYLHKLMMGVRERRIVRFLNHTERRIEALKMRIETLRGRVPEEKLDRCLRRLERVEEKLERMRTRVEEREMRGIVAELDNATSEMVRALGEVEGDYSRLLMEVDRLQAKMLILNETARRIALRGGNPTEIREEVERAKMKLREMTQHLRERREAVRRIVKHLSEHREEMAKYAERLRERIEKTSKTSRTHR